jgi:uncharacterized protein YggE
MFTTYTGRRLAGVLVALLFVVPANAQDVADHDTLRLVSVSGEGVVRAEPDQAIVRFGIVTQALDPEEARSLNATAAREAMNAVRDLGIDERKMRLESLRLQPAREYDPDTRRYKEVGFEATRQVVVEVDDLDTLPTLVARIVQKGANRLDQVTYDLKDRDAARNEALVEAVTNARDKAALLAETLGESLGRVQSINEQSFDFPRPTLRMEQAQLATAKDAAPEPEAYAAGEIEVRATVQVVFALE